MILKNINFIHDSYYIILSKILNIDYNMIKTNIYTIGEMQYYYNFEDKNKTKYKIYTYKYYDCIIICMYK